MTSMMLPIRWNWQKVFSYGEVLCFMSAWAAGILIAVSDNSPPQTHEGRSSFAVTADAPGMQASLDHLSKR